MSIQVHTPVPKRIREGIREKAFGRLFVQALNKAARKKTGREIPMNEDPRPYLEVSEAQDVYTKLREELEKRGFFDLT